MAKQPSLKYVKFTTAKGRPYAYFNTGKKVNGKTVYARLPPFGSVGFYDSYATMLGARTKREIVAYTVADLAHQYERSPEYKALAPNTQRVYSATIKRVIAELGKFPIDGVERRHVREVIDNRIEGAGAKNIFRAVIGVLYKYARNHELAEKNPAQGISLAKLGSHEPWPEPLLEAALTSDNDRLRLAVHLLYYTGQRIGDVMAMRWSDVRNGAIILKQQKTGKPLRIPIHSALEVELSSARKAGITILTRQDGHKLTASRLRQELKEFADALGFDIVPHGLRKNAVNSLLEAGCTIAEVASITGQSFQIVEQYARRVDQHRLGNAAIFKLEQKRAIQTDPQTTPETGSKSH